MRKNISQIFITFFFFHRAHLANDGRPIDNTANVFLTQTADTTQNESSSDSRSNASTAGVLKLPQINATTNI
jgi:hypothetical protein